MVRVLLVRGDSSGFRLGTSAVNVACTYGSADTVWISATGRLMALWKVILMVYPGGASGSGVGSNPPGGFSSSLDLFWSLSCEAFSGGSSYVGCWR